MRILQFFLWHIGQKLLSEVVFAVSLFGHQHMFMKSGQMVTECSVSNRLKAKFSYRLTVDIYIKLSYRFLTAPKRIHISIIHDGFVSIKLKNLACFRIYQWIFAYLSGVIIVISLIDKVIPLVEQVCWEILRFSS